MSTRDSQLQFTAICVTGERRQILQFIATNPNEAFEEWIRLMRRQDQCILSATQLDDINQDFMDSMITPVAIDGVDNVWDCSNVLDDNLIDLVFVALRQPS